MDGCWSPFEDAGSGSGGPTCGPELSPQIRVDRKVHTVPGLVLSCPISIFTLRKDPHVWQNLQCQIASSFIHSS